MAWRNANRLGVDRMLLKLTHLFADLRFWGFPDNACFHSCPHSIARLSRFLEAQELRRFSKWFHLEDVLMTCAPIELEKSSRLILSF